MKKIILLFLFLFVVDVLPRAIGWYQYPGGRNIGWDQNDGAGGGGGDTIIALTFLLDSVSTTTYSVICSLYTDSGGIARLYDSSGGSWVQVDSTDWQDGGTGFRDTLGRTGLSPETKYYYMVIAEDSCGQFDTIPKDSVTTLPLIPDISVSATICTTDIFMDTVTISNAGGTVDSFIFIDALPIGLYHDTATGKIFGACSLIFSAPQTNYRVAAYNASGADTANFALTVRLNTQIYVDHRHVDDGFPNIPDAYISLVKTKLFNVSGESHGRGYAYGIMKLDSVDGTGKYASKVFWTGPPTAAADTLRLVMGFYNGATWIPNGGEEDEYTNAAAVTVMNDFIDYCATTLVDTLTAHIFGWCWDMTWVHAPNGDTDWVYGCRWAGTSLGGPDGDTIWGLDLADTLLTSNHVCMQSYLDAIEFYDTSNSVARAVYSTGPADNHTANETGYQRRVKHQTIRAFVRADSTRVFYDYSDILSHNNAGEEYVDETGWTDFNDELQTYPTIQAVNEGTYDGGDGDCHVADTGVIRIGKGLWYLMARLSGWGGDTAALPAQYLLTVSNDGNGTTNPAGSVLVDSGVGTTVTATSGDGYVFLAWETVSGTVSWDDSTTATAHCTLSVENSEIRATFASYVTIDSIRPNPNYRNDSCSLYNSGLGTSGGGLRVISLNDTIVVYDKATPGRWDFQTKNWSRARYLIEAWNQYGLKDTSYLRIVTPRVRP